MTDNGRIMRTIGTESSKNRTTEVPHPPDWTGPPAATYRPPRVSSLGRANRLIRQNNQGHLIDGTGGWWVWGS